MSDVTETAASTLIKSGETCVSIELSRSKYGLSLWMRAAPHVEEAIKAMGAGDTTELRVFGRNWTLPPDKELYLHNIHNQYAGNLVAHDGTLYSIGYPGHPLLLKDPTSMTSKEVLNLAALRFVGVSEGAGVRIGIKGVYTREQLNTICERFKISARHFYQTYMKPVHLSITLTANVQDLSSL